MTEDYFATLHAELAARVRSGRHLSAPPRRVLGMGTRRLLSTAALVVALTASLAAVVPASARSLIAPAPPPAAAFAHAVTLPGHP